MCSAYFSDLSHWRSHLSSLRYSFAQVRSNLLVYAWYAHVAVGDCDSLGPFLDDVAIARQTLRGPGRRGSTAGPDRPAPLQRPEHCPPPSSPGASSTTSRLPHQHPPPRPSGECWERCQWLAVTKWLLDGRAMSLSQHRRPPSRHPGGQGGPRGAVCSRDALAARPAAYLHLIDVRQHHSAGSPPSGTHVRHGRSKCETK